MDTFDQWRINMPFPPGIKVVLYVYRCDNTLSIKVNGYQVYEKTYANNPNLNDEVDISGVTNYGTNQVDAIGYNEPPFEGANPWEFQWKICYIVGLNSTDLISSHRFNRSPTANTGAVYAFNSLFNIP